VTATAQPATDRTATSAGRLPSVASGFGEVLWPLYLTLLVALGGWVLVPVLALGWSPVTITSGSMGPTIQPGHVVLYEPYAGQELAEGTVVTFRDLAHDRLVTHRVVATNEDGTLRTRGDANPSDDPAPVAPEDVVGVGRLVVPSAGLPSLWVHQGRLDLLAGLAVLTALAAVPAARAGGELVRSTRRRLPRRRPTTAWRRPAIAALLVAALGAGAVGATDAAAAFTGADQNPGNQFAAASLPAPTGVTAAGSCQLLVLGPQVVVSWTAVPGATGYEIRRSTTSGGPYSSVGTSSTSSFADTGVATNRTYHYVVVGTAGTWSGPVSAQVSASTPNLCLL